MALAAFVVRAARADSVRRPRARADAVVLADRLDAYGFDAGELDQIESRLDTIYRIKQKFGMEVDELLARREAAAAELETFQSSGQKIAELKASGALYTPEGQQALMDYSKTRLEEARGVIEKAAAEAEDKAKDTDKNTAAYEGVGGQGNGSADGGAGGGEAGGSGAEDKSAGEPVAAAGQPGLGMGGMPGLGGLPGMGGMPGMGGLPGMDGAPGGRAGTGKSAAAKKRKKKERQKRKKK
mgnify:CR=1 FL=1